VPNGLTQAWNPGVATPGHCPLPSPRESLNVTQIFVYTSQAVLFVPPRAPNGLNVGWNRELASVREVRLAPRSGERPTREARRERGLAERESASAPLPNPLPAFAGRGNRTVPRRCNPWISRYSQTVRCSRGRLFFGRGSGSIASPAQRQRPPTEGRRVRGCAHGTPAPCLKPCLPSPGALRAPASPPCGHFGSFTPLPLPPTGIKRGLTEKAVTFSPRYAGEKVGMRGRAQHGPSPQTSPRFAGRGGRMLGLPLGGRLTPMPLPPRLRRALARFAGRGNMAADAAGGKLWCTTSRLHCEPRFISGDVFASS